jgi:1,4-dihydroxy-2-naphthoate octaprenyltransferase
MSGIYDGLSPDWTLAFLSLFAVMSMQGIVSHAVNDIADERIDRMANIKGTGRFKVLIQGKASTKDLYALIIGACVVIWVIMWYIFVVRGYVIMLLIFTGAFYIYAYNCKPLKLNYRPFAEYTVVVPVILLISIGFSYSIFGDVSRMVMYSAIANSLANVAWYFFSRLQDVVPDDRYDKVTTFVGIRRNFYHNGEEESIDMSLSYIWISLIFYSYIIFINLGMFYYTTSILIALYALILLYYYRSNNLYILHNLSVFSAKMRSLGMYISYANCFLISLTLYLYK